MDDLFPQGKRESKESGDPDEFDDLVSTMTGKSLSARLGNSPDMILKKSKAKKAGDGLKQSKINFKKVCFTVILDLVFTQSYSSKYQTSYAIYEGLFIIVLCYIFGNGCSMTLVVISYQIILVFPLEESKEEG